MSFGQRQIGGYVCHDVSRNVYSFALRGLTLAAPVGAPTLAGPVVEIRSDVLIGTAIRRATTIGFNGLIGSVRMGRSNVPSGSKRPGQPWVKEQRPEPREPSHKREPMRSGVPA